MSKNELAEWERICAAAARPAEAFRPEVLDKLAFKRFMLKVLKPIPHADGDKSE